MTYNGDMKPKIAMLFVAGLTVFCFLTAGVARFTLLHKKVEISNAPVIQYIAVTPSGLSFKGAYSKINDGVSLSEVVAVLGKADQLRMTEDGKNFADLIYQRGDESLVVSVDTIQDGSWRVIDVFLCQGATPTKPYGTSQKEKFPNDARAFG